MVKKYLLSKLSSTKERFKKMGKKNVSVKKSSNFQKSVKKAKSSKMLNVKKANVKTQNVKKASVRKVNKVKVVAKTQKSWLDVPHDKKFFSNDGQILSNLSELPGALKLMDNNTFSHHVKQDNNDFANWVDHVMGEQKLAENLRQLKSRSSMAKSVQKLL